MIKSIINAYNLNVGYNKKAVISNIDLTALKGQVVCLLGPNGAGKSTILKTLSGLLSPVSGIVELDGKNIFKINKNDLSRKLSLVLTEQPSPAMTTVYDLVSMGRMPYTNFMGRLTDKDHQIINEALKTTDTEKLRERYFSELSDGEKQKVLISRAIVQQPEIIILDEPTSHLDIRYKIEVIRLLQKLSNEKNITCILSLHDIDLAIKGCQTVMLVNDGKILGIGTPEEIITNGVIQKLYSITDGVYNELMGSVEFKAAKQNDIFVVSGNGTGINIYRSLARNGYGVTSGVLHENDKDFEVATGICSKTICEKAFEPICREKSAAAEKLALMQKSTVDSGFPVGSGNKENINLLKNIISMGKTVFSLRPEKEGQLLFGELANKVIYVNDISELLRNI